MLRGLEILSSVGGVHLNSSLFLRDDTAVKVHKDCRCVPKMIVHVHMYMYVHVHESLVSIRLQPCIAT